MALDRVESFELSCWFSRVRTPSMEQRMASMVAADTDEVSAPCSRRVRISFTATRYRRHSDECCRRWASCASSANISRRVPTLANCTRKSSLAAVTRLRLRFLRSMMIHDWNIISTSTAMITQASMGTALSRKPRLPKPKPDCSSSTP
ncbi:hypothetical protein D3C81_1808660 [compost metagenome]